MNLITFTPLEIKDFLTGQGLRIRENDYADIYRNFKEF